MTRAWGNLTDQALAALREHGPMTRVEIERELGIVDGSQHLAQIMCRLLKPVQRGPEPGKKRVHICRWTREDDVGRRYLRPVYKIGHRPDAPKPAPLTSKQIKAEYWARRRDRLMGASVFRLGGPVSAVMRSDWSESK